MNSEKKNVPNRKLSYKQAEMIRNMYRDGKTSMKELGELYGISRSTVSQILKNLSYKTDDSKAVITTKRYILIER